MSLTAITVYLSAATKIRREYGDQVHVALSGRYKLSMINCWPYLRLLSDERAKRLHAYNSSYLPRFFGAWNPICGELWGDADGIRLSVALR